MGDQELQVGNVQPFHQVQSLLDPLAGYHPGRLQDQDVPIAETHVGSEILVVFVDSRFGPIEVDHIVN